MALPTWVGAVIALACDWIRRLWAKRDSGLTQNEAAVRAALEELTNARRALAKANSGTDAVDLTNCILRVRRAEARLNALDPD